jgi:hypothetical protein
VKESNENITFALPRRVLRRVKILAVARQTSVSALLIEMLEEFVERGDTYAAARERALKRLERTVNLGTRGHATWMRDSLHQR